jgi:hypothetical protein
VDSAFAALERAGGGCGLDLLRLNGRPSPGDTREYSIPRAVAVFATWLLKAELRSKPWIAMTGRPQ